MPRRTDISSILVIGAAALLMGRASAQDIRIPAPTDRQTVETIADCGVPATNVRITYEDELQSELVRISDLGGADDARFHCLRKATFPYYIVDVSAAPQRQAYQAFERREGAKLARAEARDWLKTAGLLGRVPDFDPGKGLDAFAREVESACSIRPGRAFEIYGTSGLTVRRQFFGNYMKTGTFEDLSCLLRMYSASNADEHDVVLAFTGNEAPGEGKR